MNAPESSMTMRSQSESSNTHLHERVTSIIKNSKFALLLDNITQYVQNPRFFYYILIIVIVFQFIQISFWMETDFFWTHSNMSKMLSKIFVYVGCFSIPYHELTNSSMLTIFLVNFAGFLIVLVFLLMQFICFLVRRRYYKKTLYPTRFALEIISTLFIYPSATFTGQLFACLLNKDQIFDHLDRTQVIAFTVIMIIITIFQTVISYAVNSYIMTSIYLTRSPFITFNMKPFLYVLVINPYISMISYIFSYFPDWLQHPVLLLHLIFMIYTIYLFMTERPFLFMETNGIFLFAFLTSAFMDLFRLAMNCVDLSGKTTDLISFIAFFAFVIISILIPSIFYPIQTKTMLNHLRIQMETDGDTEKRNFFPTDEERIDRFAQLGLDRKEKKALAYYDLIISHNIIGYLDFFVIKYIFSHHSSTHVLEYCIRMLSFFPPQIRALNIMYNDFVQRHDLSSTQKFMIFQVLKLKMTRQSSSSFLALEKLKELKGLDTELISEVADFWSMSKCSFEYISSLSKSILRTKALWEEAIIQFPSSSIYREEYMNFHLECETNYTRAIAQRHMIDLIETGKTFNVDYCFQKFVRNFPAFLKKGIVDVKGNINRHLRANSKGSHTHNSTVSHDSKTGSSSHIDTSFTGTAMMIDMAIEEEIGRSLIQQSRIRIALQKATMDRKARSHLLYFVLSWILFVLGLGIFLFVFIYFKDFFDSSKDTVQRVRYLLETRLYTAASAITLLYFWGNHTQSIFIDDIVHPYLAVDDPDTKPLIDYQKPWEESTMYFIMESETEFTHLRSTIASLSEKGTDVYHYMSRLFEENTRICYCGASGDRVAGCRGENIKKILAYIEMQSSLLLTASNVEDFFFSNREWCSIFSTLLNIPDAFQELFDTLTEMAKDDTKKAEDLIKLIEIILPIVYVCIAVCLFLISYLRYVFEIKMFIELLLKLPPNVKKMAEKPLHKDIDDSSNEKMSTTVTGTNVPVVFGVFIVLFYIVLTVLIYFSIENIRTYNHQFDYLKTWTSNSMVRKSLLLEICLWISQLVIAKNDHVQGCTYINTTQLYEEIAYMFERLDYRTTNLMDDSGDIPSVAGVDQQIDDLFLKENCPMLFYNATYHDMYRCASSQQLFAFFMNTVTTVENQIDSYNGVMKDEVPITIFHLSSNHLIPELNRIDNRFIELEDAFSNDFFMKHLLFLIFEIVVAILIIVMETSSLRFLQHYYSLALSFMRRVNPIKLVANEDIVNYLFEMNKKDNTGIVSTDQGIIHNTSDSVLCLDLNFIIEIMNPAVTSSFGYSPEQMLGQSVLTIFLDDARESILQQLQLMVNKQSGPVYEGHTACLTDNNTTVFCAITILAMTDSGEKDDEITSFVMLLRDETQLLEQQEQAERAKKQSEQLLYQILPRDIVIRLNQGEKDISFTVPSASIMFVDIVKFSEYAASLTPQEIMGNLSLLFAGFDETITKFDRLIKIKLIGDVYMCAGGLFTPDDQPVVHCEQMLRFAIECLQVLEETNVKLNAVLNVRIGINTGGPLIAGVLGTDKPTFDIIGDPINIASRLQSTDIPGRIQISEDAYQIIKELDFQIEERGEIYLKGKGNRMAYLVSPTSISISGLNSYIHESSEGVLG